jgi:hypothetical protein
MTPLRQRMIEDIMPPPGLCRMAGAGDGVANVPPCGGSA